MPLEFVLDPANHVPRDAHVRGRHDRQRTTSPTASASIWGATASMLITLSRMLREAADVNRIERCSQIMARLRDPQRGCPWDREQDLVVDRAAHDRGSVRSSRTRSSAASPRACATSSATCCSRSCSRRASPRSADSSISTRGRRDQRQARAPPSARLRRCRRSTTPRHRRRPGNITRQAERAAARRRHGALDGVALGAAGADARREARHACGARRLRLAGHRGVLDKVDEEIASCASRCAAADRDRSGRARRRAVQLAQAARHLASMPRPPCAANSKFERRFRTWRRSSRNRAEAAQVGADELESLWSRAKRELG